jgi:hypothetical protein
MMMHTRHGLLLIVATLLLPAAAANAALLAHLRLDDATTAAAVNEAGPDGAYENFVVGDLLQPASPGKDSVNSVHLDDPSGGRQRINLGPNPAHGAKALTIAMWVNLDAGTFGSDHTFASAGDFRAPANLIFWRDDSDGSNNGADNSVALLVNGNRTVSAAGILNATGWHHVAMIWEANSSDGLRIYFDGVRSQTGGDIAVGDETIGQTEGLQDLVLGQKTASGGDNGKQFIGFMDEVGVWSDALPDSSILALANGSHTPGTVPIPEPATLALLVLGATVAMRRRGN